MAATCRACGSEIVWGRLPGERWVPLDPELDPTGEMVLLRDGQSAMRLGRKGPIPEPAEWPEVQRRRHADHRRICPLAGLSKPRRRTG